MDIIDSHQHFWNYIAEDFPWIDDSMGILKNNFLPEQYLETAQQHGVVGSVVVQARQSREETDWLISLSEKHRFILGVVGWLDLCAPEIAPQLEKYSKCEKLIGLRHQIHDEPDDDYMMRKEFKRGISLLKDYDLAYDLLIFAKHLPIANDLVKEFPHQKFVIDHIAKPNMRGGNIKDWLDGIENISKNNNVYCKISGMVTETEWNNWEKDDFLVFMNAVYDAFGEDRIMFGSDWPVCTLSADYEEVLDICFNWLNNYSLKTKEKFLYQNAKHIYGI